MSGLARLLTVGFDGTQAPPALLDLVRSGLGGVILFRRNIESPAQLLGLIGALKRAAGAHRLVVSIDQEGGRVARLHGAPWAPVPPMRRFGALPLPEGLRRVRAFAELLGRELRAVGVDLDLAPVLDTDTNPENPVIGDRSFSSRPERVAALGTAFIESLQAGGVAACGKHFPGHGDTVEDSHLALPRIRHDRRRLDTVELVPFRAASRAGVAAIMSAHITCDAIDPALPATLSPAVLGLLRDQIGFRGAIVSDDLEMQAITRDWRIEEAAPLALAAGCDQLLVCRDLGAVPHVIAAVHTAITTGRLPASRIEDARARWNALAERYAAPAPDRASLAWLGSTAHAAAIDAALGGLA